jgi:pyruvate dehydrogenase E2 component (dihydrolipoamide acetyltransferase)
MGDFTMPSLGADMDEGTLLEWLVEPGQDVHRGDIVAIVDTAKSAVEIECFEDGTVEELVANEGDVVPVGGVLARLDGHRGATGAEAPAAVTPPKTAEKKPPPTAKKKPPPTAAPEAATPPVSPPLRHRAHELGIDLDTIAGTGRSGAVTRKDLERAARELAAQSRPAVDRPAPAGRPRVSPYARRLAKELGVDLGDLAGTGAGGTVTAEDVHRAAAKSPEAVSPEAAPEAVSPEPAPEAPARASRADADSMRQRIAALMTTSNQEIPHYYLSTTVDMSVALEWMGRRNRELSVGERLVPSAMVLLATARTARAVPDLNGHWVDGGFKPASSVDLGLILSLRRGGLLVPAIADADSLTVEQTMARMRELTTRARAGRLRGSDLKPPSLTVSNLGDQGVESVLGVIYPPQVALVGVGAVSERPWAINGMLGVRPLVTITLAGDHRASDGAVGSRFLKHLDHLLQAPEEL